MKEKISLKYIDNLCKILQKYHVKEFITEDIKLHLLDMPRQLDIKKMKHPLNESGHTPQNQYVSAIDYLKDIK